MPAASRFIHIDGVRIHYRDEGAGPAVLLLHGNFGNLLDWDPWVARSGTNTGSYVST
jgi:pimeloyl-ACP methyl ester carboxylesterase